GPCALTGAERCLRNRAAPRTYLNTGAEQPTTEWGLDRPRSFRDADIERHNDGVSDDQTGCTAGRPLSVEAIERAEAELGSSLPEALRAVYVSGDGRYRDDGEWWVLWPLARVVEDTKAGWKNGSLPHSVVAFGDDGTGDPFCIETDEAGSQVVLRWSAIDGTAVGNEGAVEDFLRRWCGPPAQRT